MKTKEFRRFLICRNNTGGGGPRSWGSLSRLNQNQKGNTSPSAVRANLDDPPIHIRPLVPALAGEKDRNPVGSGRYGIQSIAPARLNRNGSLCRKCQESGDT